MIENKEINRTFEKYPAYKDSGSYWSGQIPKEWNALPIRAIFEERNEKNDGPKTDFILSVTKDRGVIPYDEKGAIGNNKSEEIERYKLVYPNDFVINKMNVVIGSLGMSKYFGAFSQVYLVYKPKTSQINIEYYSYIFSNPTFYKSLIKFCTGIMELRESLNKSDFKKIILPFPNFESQTSIVNFLDDKTSKIDTAIGQKEQMIALLKERKQIIIQNAVTKGLDPNAKMKDSGVEWIGVIPEGWEISKLRYYIEILSGYAFPSKSFANEGVRLLRGINVGVDEIRWDESVSWPNNKLEGLSSYFLDIDDIIIGMDRPLIGKGMRVAKIEKKDLPCLLLQRVTRVRAIKGLKQEYLILILQNQDFINYFLPILSGVSVPHISPNQIQSYPICLPSLLEQSIILKYLKNENNKIDRAITLQQSQIEKLKEYKATLIDGAVTGKIIVSG